MLCVSCGKENNDTVRFCGYCGTCLTNTTTTPAIDMATQKHDTAASTNHIPLLVIGCAIFLFVISLYGINVYNNLRKMSRIETVYADQDFRVHMVTVAGKDKIVSGTDRCDDPKLADDSRTAGWLLVHHIAPGDLPGPNSNYEFDIADRLVLYRNGKVLRSIEASAAMIRSWGFWEKGTQVVTYEGGLHFAGEYYLYDIETGALLEADKDPATPYSPDWVKSLQEISTTEQ